MAENEAVRTVTALLERYNHESFSEQAGISIKDSPNTLYQVFELGVLLDGRVDPDTSVDAFLQLEDRGWTTAKKMTDAPTGELNDLLVTLGYPETDADRIAVGLGDAALHLLEDHGGDLGGVRKVVDHDPQREREELLRFARVRDRSVDGFFREIQVLWDELHPFADKPVLDAARRLDLGNDADTLRRHVDDAAAFVRLIDALVRIRETDHGYEELRAAVAAA